MILQTNNYQLFVNFINQQVDRELIDILHLPRQRWNFCEYGPRPAFGTVPSLPILCNLRLSQDDLAEEAAPQASQRWPNLPR